MTMSNHVSQGSGASAMPVEELASAFMQVEAEIAAVPAAELLPVNIDVPGTVTTVLGAYPEVQRLRTQLASLPGVNIERLDRLRVYALALGHAHALYRAAVGPDDGIAALVEELTELRDGLYEDALALSRRGLMQAEAVAKLRSPSGYKNIAIDVAGLVNLFRERWVSLTNKTAVEVAELDRASKLAQQLLTAVGIKEQSPVALGAASATRQKVFTLVVRTYDEARRGITYLRWREEDWDDIAPSLYAGRRAKAASKPDADLPATPPAAQPPTGTPPATSSPRGGDTGDMPIPPGFPGGSPFARS